jgi:hypothetical protein
MSTESVYNPLQKRFRIAIAAATMVCGLAGSGAALVIHAPSSSAVEPQKCMDDPDGPGCTKGKDGAGGGIPGGWVADQYGFQYTDFLGGDIYQRNDGGAPDATDALTLSRNLYYKSCYVPLMRKTVVRCLDT